MTTKRGRPTLAAKSLDDALTAHYGGKSPLRPRNTFEQQVMRQVKGRKQNPLSPTRQAAQYTAYLIQSELLPLAEASRRASSIYHVNPDNVRKYARALINGPKTTIAIKVTPMFSQLVSSIPREVSLVANIDYVNTFFDTEFV
jgi:hypothetical protein